MIAPVKENRPTRRRSPLQAARLAVADALLTERRQLRTGSHKHVRRAWLLVGSLIVLAVAYLLTIDWWVIEK